MWNGEARRTSASNARPPEERRQVAWVGKSVVFKGDLSSSEDMIIDGTVEGSITVDSHGLTLGPDANIRATIVARKVTVLGAVRGSITAGEVVVLLETARVDGDILAPRLAIEDGALLSGRISTGDRAAAPSKDAPTSG